MKTIEIDGSYLEGGGQILRTAVALSLVTQNPIYVKNIRANRAEPGIRPSHAASIEAVAKMCDAEYTGKVGDTELEFIPGKLQDRHISVNIGTAGSVPLVLQTVMLPAMFAKEIEIDIKGGGTATKWAPTINYIKNVTLEILTSMGYKGSIDVLKHGFYPKGGAHVIFKSKKSHLSPINKTEPGEIVSVSGIGIASKDLKKNDVGERLKEHTRRRLFKKFKIIPNVEYEYVDSLSTGTSINVFVKTENSIWGANSLGEPRKRIEYVVNEAVTKLGKEAKQNKLLDEFMADQIIPYMALTRNSTVSVEKITNHLKTNIAMTEKFLPAKFEIDEENQIVKCRT